MTFPARDLLNNWDQQQNAYIAHREERFTAALDVLAMTFGDDFHVVDVACGPGSFSLRLLNRFPNARVTAIDLDPLLLTLAKEAMIEHKDRIQFIHADIALPTCFDSVEGKPQAMVSSTAIHWLLPEQQTVLYRNIYHTLDQGGLFMNADHQRFDNRNPRQKLMAQMHDELTQEQGWAAGAQDWDTWFETATRHPELAEKMDERTAIFAGRPMPLPTPIEFQLAMLRQAGFDETGTVWQFLDDYVIAGWK
ncbi:class I SAM-dependent methyltransferase [Citrobacter werkmanii]|uniref:class I SAM-dependent methyltransferase n=1 Tax=unclassified Citrobacter TaxID=2644389 RepID=UPI001906C0FA|nr:MULTISPECIES: class I SAM-dependent methyltransferase [Citrobacter]MBJ9872458.1 class I SAM-dependent methyltransferase [Citrobacter werkmanii]MDM2930861.1 class I SAM-dependent methyltransferase [Citrobacter sp. Cm046]MDM2942040.1 class I SAM-dependent methyltransferase [Citrobacter sp. Cm038]HEB0854502.1 class I SAM-dependent methyltransferase [Citrobacter freundii]